MTADPTRDEWLDEERWHDAQLGVAPRAQLVRASSIRVERPAWAWQGRIPLAGVTLLAGREGRGKTALAGHLAARLSRGQLAGDLHGEPADVVYVGVEDDRASVLVPRLMAAGADLDRVHFLDLPDGVPFAIADDLEVLDALLRPLCVALVVIDPLDSSLGAQIDSHRKAEVQRAVGQLAQVAQRHRCGVVGIAHLNKGDASDLLTRVVGSVGFTTSTRSVIGVGEHPGDERDRVAVLAKSNLTDAAQVPALRFRVERAEIAAPDDGSTIETAAVAVLGEEHGIDPHSIVTVLGTDERTERDEAADWLLDLLADGPMPYREIERLARDDGHSRATLHRARPRAGVIVERDDGQRGRPSTWRLSSPPISSPPHGLPGETKPNPSGATDCEPVPGVSSHVSGVPTREHDRARLRCLEGLE